MQNMWRKAPAFSFLGKAKKESVIAQEQNENDTERCTYSLRSSLMSSAVSPGFLSASRANSYAVLDVLTAFCAVPKIRSASISCLQ